jgi:hypothetical protein
MEKIKIDVDVYDDSLELNFPCGRIIFDRNLEKIKKLITENDNQFDFSQLWSLLKGK